MTALKLLLSASLIAAATSAFAFTESFSLPILTFPEDDDIISTQSCETDPQTGVLICGTGD
ncbi:hypothetical protein [Cognatishimia sp. MH4019]|uniref:hypothetical protein n=1 Tax=Cognatishimia sp. MH4019 TaxID=2854030 RepID=UPI001CD4E2B9|nr:hypothetical protein [Cognatishimia sp. MH4019]